MADYYQTKNNEIQQEHSMDVEETIVFHRQRFRNIIYSRIVEALPLLINYDNKKCVAIDFLTLELNLREGQNVVVGMMTNGEIGILGITNSIKKSSRLTLNNAPTVLTKNDINFRIHPSLRLDEYKEITSYDNYTSGEFVVLSNKYISQMNDSTIINHYTDELTEIVVTRFSLIIQGKFSKAFISEINDETINQLITKLHNGSPFVKLGSAFSVQDSIQDITSTVQVQMLSELKREYQNKINEMLTFFGIDNIAIDKNSGVSNGEVVSNNPFTNVNANVYLKGREPIKHLCKRYNLPEIKPYFSANVQAELSEQNQGANNG